MARIMLTHSQELFFGTKFDGIDNLMFDTHLFNLVLRAIYVPALDEPHHTKYLLAVKPFAERQQMPWGRGWHLFCLLLKKTNMGFRFYITAGTVILSMSQRSYCKLEASILISIFNWFINQYF